MLLSAWLSHPPSREKLQPTHSFVTSLYFKLVPHLSPASSSDLMAEGNPAAAAALPWAAGADVKPVQDNSGAEAVSEEDLQPVSMQQLGLQPGTCDRIEVGLAASRHMCMGQGRGSAWHAPLLLTRLSHDAGAVGGPTR